MLTVHVVRRRIAISTLIGFYSWPAGVTQGLGLLFKFPVTFNITHVQPPHADVTAIAELLHTTSSTTPH